MGGEVPTVSLIVLNWNGKRHLEDCLGSLVALDYPIDRLQLILCDNGSTDGSVEFVHQRFPRVEVVALDLNHGFAEGNNLAAKHATGKWLGFLNNDMCVDPSWVRDMLVPLSEQPQLACIASRILSWTGRTIDFVGGGVNFQGFGFQIDFGKESSIHDRARRILFACGGAMLIKRTVFEEMEGFDSDYFAFYEDVDLGWRLNLLGYDVWFNPVATAYHRSHSAADMVAPSKMRMLYERNALFTIYKCLDAENLAKALPACLLLLNERSLRMGGVDVRPFLFGPNHRPAPTPGIAIKLHAYDPAEPSPSPLARVRNVLREKGLRTLVHKTLRRIRGLIAALTTGTLRRLVPSGVLVPEVAIANYVAVSEFAYELESMQAKRRRLQERRQRPDSELIPMFQFALTPNYSDRHYVETFHKLCTILGLDEVFGSGQH